MGRQVGVCGGCGGSQHLQRENFYSNGIQGGIVPVAIGLALGHKIKETGGVSVVFIGDGTLGEGVVYEAMNIASKWELPILFVCDNNLYSQSTQQAQTLAGSIVGCAEAFGVEGYSQQHLGMGAIISGCGAEPARGALGVTAGFSSGRYLSSNGPFQRRR